MSKPIFEGDKFLLKLLNNVFSLADFEEKGLDFDYLDKNEKLKIKDKKKIVDFLKKAYYDKYVIKSDNVPVDYLRKKRRVCNARGVNFSKNREINKVIKCQEKSLDMWINYLMSNDIDYPMWVRCWAFQGVLDLSYYDCDKHVFNSRTSKTIFPFAKLDCDALDSTIKSVMSYYENVSEDELDIIAKQSNFGKLYSRFLWNNENKFEKDDVNDKDGVWIKYSQGSDCKKILSAIDGKFTSWCFDDESLASDYLAVSDIYIYFTEDYNGTFTMPRIAIVTERDEVAEVRGIADSNQNVEFQMFDVLDGKLKEFKHDVKYDLMLGDMKKVYEILNKENKGEQLSKEDLFFMYECDRNIAYFGKDKDYEILKFMSRRNTKDDYAVIYGCSSDLVGFDSFDLEKDLYVYVGDIKNYSEKFSENFRCPTVVLGNFVVPYLKSFEGFENLSVVKGDFIANNMIDASDFKDLETIGGRLVVGNLKNDFLNLKFVDGKPYGSKINNEREVKKLVLDKVSN